MPFGVLLPPKNIPVFELALLPLCVSMCVYVCGALQWTAIPSMVYSSITPSVPWIASDLLHPGYSGYWR